MEEFSDSYDGCEADAPASWAEQQHECVQELDEVETLRRKVKFYFMNPCEKYHARGRKPWKLMLQIVKIAIITIQVVHFYTWSGQVWCSFVFFIFGNTCLILWQLVYFGLSNQMVVQFREENLITFKQIFLKDFDEDTDTYAIYRQDDVYKHIEFIIYQVEQR